MENKNYCAYGKHIVSGPIKSKQLAYSPCFMDFCLDCEWDLEQAGQGVRKKDRVLSKKIQLITKS